MVVLYRSSAYADCAEQYAVLDDRQDPRQAALMALLACRRNGGTREPGSTPGPNPYGSQFYTKSTEYY